MPGPRYVLSLLIATLLVGCGPTTRVLKLPNASSGGAPVPPNQIEVYRHLSQARCDYDRIALIEAQESETVGFTGGVSQLELIRAARKEAGKLGANAISIDAMTTRQFTETEVEADSTGYERTESRKQIGQGVFLAIREHRPCEASEGS